MFACGNRVSGSRNPEMFSCLFENGRADPCGKNNSLFFIALLEDLPKLYYTTAESHGGARSLPEVLHILVIIFLNSKGFQKHTLMPCLRLLSKVWLWWRHSHLRFCFCTHVCGSSSSLHFCFISSLRQSGTSQLFGGCVWQIRKVSVVLLLDTVILPIHFKATFQRF